MSLTQTYYLAHSARAKLSKEAARADHELRLLVGHANLLDGLMLDLAQAEREQESWFNQSMKGASKDEPKHISWEEDDEEDDEYTWDDSDVYEETLLSTSEPSRRAPSPPVLVTSTELDSDSDEDADDEFEDEELTLTRTQSHSSHTPPELSEESESESEGESDSEDESMPSTPPQDTIPFENPFSQDRKQEIVTTSFYLKPEESSSSSIRRRSSADDDDYYTESYYFPERQQAPSVAAY